MHIIDLRSEKKYKIKFGFLLKFFNIV